MTATAATRRQISLVLIVPRRLRPRNLIDDSNRRGRRIMRPVASADAEFMARTHAPSRLLKILIKMSAFYIHISVQVR